jgi:hypothetical protein
MPASTATRYDAWVTSSDAGLLRTRLLQTFDLFEAGVSLKRASLRREHPDARPEEIDHLIREWLATRSGAEHGVPRSRGAQQ